MEDKERTLFCGNLSEKVTEDILYELFLQAGPLENVTIPKEKDGRPRNYAFIAFKHPVSVQYAVALMSGISLYGRTLRLDARSGSVEANPYLQKLQQYSKAREMQHNNHGYYPQNDNRYQQPNSYNSPQAYPVFNQQPFFSRQLVLPQPVNNQFNSTHRRYDDYGSSRSGYRY
ncbi:splicing regulator RBM11 [Parasteatoda tepidariorum]|uniref:splicing regulator RBM11 n=1 Tax=Parasteatoda tepidariorum TaxID=114398 RepID=UPI00077FCB2D|nr:splicing regulator RBM11 [Parasteatoda tepidariorum]